MTAVLAPETRLPRLAAWRHRVLDVELRAPDGHTWNAIGGRETVAAAVGWSDLYGD